MQADGSYILEPDSLQSYSYNDWDWRRLDVPHDWGIEGPFRIDLDGYTGKLPWKGIGWYRKYFEVSSKDKKKRFYLDFDGAMANAEVWLNGNKVGEWAFGYSSFRVDLTPYLLYDKKNVVAVRLNTEKFGSRWYPGAGIYRHVRLVKTNPVHVGQWGVFVTTPEITDEQANALVHVEIQNNLSEAVDGQYVVDIYELDKDDVPGAKVAVVKKQLLLKPNQLIGDTVSLLVNSPK